MERTSPSATPRLCTMGRRNGAGINNEREIRGKLLGKFKSTHQFQSLEIVQLVVADIDPLMQGVHYNHVTVHFLRQVDGIIDFSGR